jgi:hypothetical protein
MKIQSNSLKICLTVLITVFTFIANTVSADDNKAPEVKPLEIGDTFPSVTYEHPDETKDQLKPDTKYVIVSFEMELSKGIHNWLAEKETDYLAKHKAEYIADITKMPAIITFLFARPKMKKYKFPILLAKDERFAPQFPVLEGKFALFELDEARKVKEVRYFKDMDTLAKIVFGEEPKTDTANAK